MNTTESIQQIKAVQDPQLGTVVREFLYVLTAAEGDKTEMCVRRIVLDEPNANSFIPFDSLLEQNALAWAVNHLGQSEIEAMKNGMAAKMASTTSNQAVNVPPPWK